VPGRKRFPSEPPHPNHREPNPFGNSSPLVLQRLYHQQQQQQIHPQQQNVNHVMQQYHNHYPAGTYSTAQSSKMQISNDEPDNAKEEESSNLGKKRFTSYLKFSIGGSNNSVSNSPSCPSRIAPPRPARHASPGPPPPSPDPPPRLSRLGLSDGTQSYSPLVGRRSFLDVSPVRRGVLDVSPSLPRR